MHTRVISNKLLARIQMDEPSDFRSGPCIKCPSVNFNSHDACHEKYARYLFYKQLMEIKRENIHPSIHERFQGVDQQLNEVFEGCFEDQHYEFYSKQLHSTTELIRMFILTPIPIRN